jgi:hypothetical protein
VAAGVGEDEGDRLVKMRLDEDEGAISELGATRRTLPFLDAIYRGSQYPSAPSLQGSVHASDNALLHELTDVAVSAWRDAENAIVYLPLAIGNHVDHQICARLHESLRGAGAVVTTRTSRMSSSFELRSG